jgi:tetratricopeptide (TPR) repeat protein
MALSFEPRVPAIGSLRQLFVAAGLGLALLAPIRVEAEEHRFDRPQEMYMLPEYCKYTQDFRDHVPGGNNEIEIQRWTKLMGETFIHMHHYCYALQATNRAVFLSRTHAERQHNLFVSIYEFNYVIHNATPDFALLPDIYTRKGEALIQMGKVGEGMADLQRAIDMKPDHWQAYAAISDYYKDLGQPAKAREWLQKGLAIRPDTRALMRRLSSLDAAQGKRANNP